MKGEWIGIHTYPWYHILYSYLEEFDFVHLFCNILQEPGWLNWQVSGDKRNKTQIWWYFQYISNAQVFCIMLEKETESSPHSLLKKVKDISKTA